MKRKVNLSRSVVELICNEIIKGENSEIAIKLTVNEGCYYVNQQNELFLPCLPQRVYMPFTALEKTLLFFFSFHPEGILIKELPQYKEELENIYFGLSVKTSRSNKVIDNLIHIKSNRFYEVNSSIRHKVAKWVGLNVANLYCIEKNENNFHQLKATFRYVK